MEKETTSRNLRATKEVWLNKLRYKKVKLEKCVEKRQRKLDNLMFQRDQKNFFRTLEADDTKEGEMPEMRSLLSSREEFGNTTNLHQISHGWRR